MRRRWLEGRQDEEGARKERRSIIVAWIKTASFESERLREAVERLEREGEDARRGKRGRLHTTAIDGLPGSFEQILRTFQVLLLDDRFPEGGAPALPAVVIHVRHPGKSIGRVYQ